MPCTAHSHGPCCSYAGTYCRENSLQLYSDPVYHAVSLLRMTHYKNWAVDTLVRA